MQESENSNFREKYAVSYDKIISVLCSLFDKKVLVHIILLTWVLSKSSFLVKMRLMTCENTKLLNGRGWLLF